MAGMFRKKNEDVNLSETVDIVTHLRKLSKEYLDVCSAIRDGEQKAASQQSMVSIDQQMGIVEEEARRILDKIVDLNEKKSKLIEEANEYSDLVAHERALWDRIAAAMDELEQI
jgi:predicted  nucleic acid-binding Zn-ribbon protein